MPITVIIVGSYRPISRRCCRLVSRREVYSWMRPDSQAKTPPRCTPLSNFRARRHEYFGVIRVFGGGGVPLSIAPLAPDKSIPQTWKLQISPVARRKSKSFFNNYHTQSPHQTSRTQSIPKDICSISAAACLLSALYFSIQPRTTPCTLHSHTPIQRARRVAQPSVEEDDNCRQGYCPQSGTYSSHPKPAPSAMDGSQSGSTPNGRHAAEPYRFPSERMQRVLGLLKFS